MKTSAASRSCVRSRRRASSARLVEHAQKARAVPTGHENETAPLEWSFRSWLWHVLEHEIHHPAQLAEYMRQLGVLSPFFAFVLSRGQRPDIEIRASLGGV
jgi:uncharacterized damage-inducible protein DinB